MTNSVQAHSPGADFPTLKSWLSGASQDHPWFEAINNPNFPCIACLSVMEEILNVLEKAHPNFLEKKKLEFKNNLKQGASFDFRLEFLVLVTLLNRRIKADFLGDGQPDIELSLNGKSFQIEVTRRANSDIDDFHGFLEDLLENTDFVGEIVMGTRALTLHPDLRREAKSSVENFLVNPIRDNFVYSSELSLEHDFSIRLYRSNVSQFSKVNVIDSGNVTNSLQRVEGIIAKQLEQKNKQARIWDGTTILLIDISGLGYSWMRSPADWASWSNDWKIDWSNSKFPILVFTFSDLTRNEISFFAKLNPSLSEERRDEYIEVLKLLRNDEITINV